MSRPTNQTAIERRNTAEETIDAIREILWPDGIAGDPWDSAIGDDIAAELHVHALEPATDGELRTLAEQAIADLIAMLWPEGLDAVTEGESSIGDNVGGVLRTYGFGPDREEFDDCGCACDDGEECAS